MALSRAWRTIAGAFVAVSLSAAARAQADDVADEAELHFRLGTERYTANDYRGALEHFLASNRLAPNRNVLLNIGRSFEQLRQPADAYRYYLQALEGETDPGRADKLRQSIARVEPSIAIVSVQTDPPGATLYLDKKELGARGTAPRTFGLVPGRYRVLASLPGYEDTASDEIEVAAGARPAVRLRLKPFLGRVSLDGPRGVEVRLDQDVGPAACRLPCQLDAVPGAHTLHFDHPHFFPSGRAIQVPPEGKIALAVRLTARSGTLLVDADARGASVRVDDVEAGFTPLVRSISVGSHRVSVAREGYRPVERVVTVEEGRPTEVDAELIRLDRVEAASRRLEGLERAPASVTVIPREELRAMGYPTVAEALRGVRGMYVSDDRTYVSTGIRGISRSGDFGNRMLLLSDGHPTNDTYVWSSYPGLDGRTDLYDVERIEVVRGPGSVLYGTSAFFGVVNVVTRGRGEKPRTEVSLSSVQEGVMRGRASHGGTFGRDGGYWLSVSGAQGQGRDWYYPELVATPNDPQAPVGADGRPANGLARGVDGVKAGTVAARAWHGPWNVQAFYTSREKELPSAIQGSVFNSPRSKYTDTRGWLEARFEPKLSAAVTSLTRAHLNLYNFSGDLEFPAPSGLTREHYWGRWVGLEQRFAVEAPGGVRVTVGGEVIRHARAELSGADDQGPYTFDDAGRAGRDDPFWQAAAYGNVDWPIAPAFRLSAGGRFDYLSSQPNPQFVDYFNPRVAGFFTPYPDGLIKVIAAKALRAPSVLELFYNNPAWFRSVGLQPEQIYSAEVEYTHRFTEATSLTLGGFFNYITDLVELNPVAAPDGTEARRYDNAGVAVVNPGAEVEFRHDWRRGAMFTASYGLYDPRYDQPGGRLVPNSIQHLASVKGGFPIAGRALGAFSRLTFEGPRADANARPGDPPQGKSNPGLLWDLVFSGDLDALRIQYNVGLYNVADWRHSSIPSAEFLQRRFPQPGRTVLASLTWTLH
jgi:outer membrane receptor protein involved in Fe transport